MVSSSAAGSAGVRVSGSASAPSLPGAAIRSAVSGVSASMVRAASAASSRSIELGLVEPPVTDGGAQQFDNPVAVRIGCAQRG